MNTRIKRDRGLAGEGSSPASNLMTRTAGTLTLIAMLALGATGAVAALVTAAVVALVGFAVSRLAVKRSPREGEVPLDPDFRRFTGQLP
jgi:hypothetical protein